MLRYYGERFDSVEINNTFYRMPRTEVLETWAEQVPDDFVFTIKASRRITHIKRLLEDDSLAYLYKQLAALGDKLGPVLFQLPPNFRKDLERLEAFLSRLPAGQRAAMEFRHDSWDSEDVHDALRAHDVALCLADTEDKPARMIRTAEWGYLRLRDEYDDAALERWANEIAAQPWAETYVYFKHEDKGTGPEFAGRFRKLAQL
jgi:uncharacterized protein YecE (DUF72 family)